MRQLSIDLTGECDGDVLSSAHSDTAYVSFRDLSGHADAVGTTGDGATSPRGCTASSSWAHNELFLLRYVLSLTALVLALGSIHMSATQHYHGRVCFSSRQSGVFVATSCEVYQNLSYALATDGSPDVKIWDRVPMETASLSNASLSTSWPLDIDNSRMTGARVMTFTGGWPLGNSVMHLVVSVLLTLLLIFLRVVPTTVLPVGMLALVAVALATTIVFGTWLSVVC